MKHHWWWLKNCTNVSENWDCLMLWRWHRSGEVGMVNHWSMGCGASTCGSAGCGSAGASGAAPSPSCSMGAWNGKKRFIFHLHTYHTQTHRNVGRLYAVVVTVVVKTCALFKLITMNWLFDKSINGCLPKMMSILILPFVCNVQVPGWCTDWCQFTCLHTCRYKLPSQYEKRDLVELPGLFTLNFVYFTTITYGCK